MSLLLKIDQGLFEVGALLSGWTADKIGRKRTIQLGCIVATIGMSLSVTKSRADE